VTTLDDQLPTNGVESTQPRAFNASELVACPACSRTNPPTRAKCLYCGAELGISVQPSMPAAGALAKPETDDLFHVVLLTTAFDQREPSAEFARLINLSLEELNVLLNGYAAPLFCSKAASEADAVCDKLRAIGIDAVTVSDQQLRLEAAPTQVSALTITADALTASVRRTGERLSARWDDIVVIVLGRLYFTTREVEQTTGKSTKVIEERQITSDEAVIDVYMRENDCVWQIRSGSFDFSCLAANKRPTAFENFSALKNLLKENATNSIFDGGYLRMRAVLSKVWPPETKVVATEKRRALMGAFDTTATASDNELQFTRYSRLLRVLAPQLQDDAQQS
jgi:hypothetical protein